MKSYIWKQNNSFQKSRGMRMTAAQWKSEVSFHWCFKEMSRLSLYGHSVPLFMSPFSCYFNCTNPKLPGTSAKKSQGGWKSRVGLINRSTPYLLGWRLMTATLTTATVLSCMRISLFISSRHLSRMRHVCATGFPVYSPHETKLCAVVAVGNFQGTSNINTWNGHNDRFL